MVLDNSKPYRKSEAYRNGVTLLLGGDKSLELTYHVSSSFVALFGEALFNLDGAYRAVYVNLEAEDNGTLKALILCDVRIYHVLVNEPNEGFFATGVLCRRFNDRVVNNLRFFGRYGGTTGLLVILQVINVNT